MAKRSKKTKGQTAGYRDIAPASKPMVSAETAWLSRDWVLGLILLIAVVVAYQPVWYAEFIWDDDAHVTNNPCIIGPLGLKEIWTTSAAWYYPLTSTTFWIEHALWGLRPLPYHAVNVLMQGACAVVLWRVLLSLRVPGAWLGAAIWALHPVQVQSVAWVTELKNTQSGLFYLLAILFYVNVLKGQSRGSLNNALAFIWAMLAMASKSSTVVLPLVLCLCAWWMEGRWHWRTMARLWPIFLMSLVASAATIWTVKLNVAGEHSEPVRGLMERLATAGDVFWFYLGKLVWPSPLIFIYPRWEIDPRQVHSYLPLVVVILVMGILWAKRATWGRACFFATAYFVIALLPVLGLVDQYFWRYSFVGDHFQYLASMGPLALIGAGLVRLADLSLPRGPWLRQVLAAGSLLVLGTLSWQLAWIYRSDETLWTDTLAKNPGCALASNNLGNMEARERKVAQAISLFQAGLKANPRDADLCNSLGNALLQMGNIDGAIEQFQKALEIDPANVGAYNNLGTAFAQEGQVNQAIIQYEQALQINPAYADAHNNLGNVLLQNGQSEEAMKQFRAALKINPNHVDALNNLGWSLLQKGRMDEAIEKFNAALKIDPSYVKSLNNLGIALAQSGHLDEAIARFQEALRIKSDDVNAQNNLARAQALEGQGSSAK
jgi:tetratricopeptide (TPR) repeat protein